ncbi:Cyclin-A2-2 [Senna tora]|uniref:Cyclin-A2-2 n=1 Tax=Senna tora TaxID=362788 RepID=A0A834T8S9_9FABA|nr:Cyclin-A2-2 [Senna tora]
MKTMVVMTYHQQCDFEKGTYDAISMQATPTSWSLCFVIKLEERKRSMRFTVRISSDITEAWDESMGSAKRQSLVLLDMHRCSTLSFNFSAPVVLYVGYISKHCPPLMLKTSGSNHRSFVLDGLEEGGSPTNDPKALAFALVIRTGRSSSLALIDLSLFIFACLEEKQPDCFRWKFPSYLLYKRPNKP